MTPGNTLSVSNATQLCPLGCQICNVAKVITSFLVLQKLQYGRMSTCHLEFALSACFEMEMSPVLHEVRFNCQTAKPDVQSQLSIPLRFLNLNTLNAISVKLMQPSLYSIPDTNFYLIVSLICFLLLHH